jgi:hypothetical protein
MDAIFLRDGILYVLNESFIFYPKPSAILSIIGICPGLNNFPQNQF